MAPEERQRQRERRALEDGAYKHIIIDDRIESIANFRIEPPTLFKGRGEHPKAGLLKQRIMPEDVQLNLSKNAFTPMCGLSGRS